MRFLLAITLSLFLAIPAFAAFHGGQNSEYGGKGGPMPVTVQAAKGMRDDTFVTLTGNIVSRIRGDKYRFQDATGEITLDIDEKDFRGQDVTPKDTVRIFGEVDKDFGEAIEIDVKRLEVIK